MKEVTISRRYDFEAAHFLPHVPNGHKCLNMHGHSYVVEVEVTGIVQQAGGEAGMVCDFDPVDSCWRKLWKRIDHTCLNESWTENPTVENCARLVHQHFIEHLNAPFMSVRVVYREGPRSSCTYPPIDPRDVAAVWSKLIALEFDNAAQAGVASKLQERIDTLEAELKSARNFRAPSPTISQEGST